MNTGEIQSLRRVNKLFKKTTTNSKRQVYIYAFMHDPASQSPVSNFPSGVAPVKPSFEHLNRWVGFTHLLTRWQYQVMQTFRMTFIEKLTITSNIHLNSPELCRQTRACFLYVHSIGYQCVVAIWPVLFCTLIAVSTINTIFVDN